MCGVCGHICDVCLPLVCSAEDLSLQTQHSREFLGPASFCLPILKSQAHAAMPAFYLSAGELNSGLLPIEPPPQPTIARPFMHSTDIKDHLTKM